MVAEADGTTFFAIGAGVVSIIASFGGTGLGVVNGDWADSAALMMDWALSLDDDCLKNVYGLTGLFTWPGSGLTRNSGRGRALGLITVSCCAGRGSGAAPLLSVFGIGYGFQFFM